MIASSVPRRVEVRGWGAKDQMRGPIEGAGGEGRRP